MWAHKLVLLLPLRPPTPALLLPQLHLRLGMDDARCLASSFLYLCLLLTLVKVLSASQMCTQLGQQCCSCIAQQAFVRCW